MRDPQHLFNNRTVTLEHLPAVYKGVIVGIQRIWGWRSPASVKKQLQIISRWFHFGAHEQVIPDGDSHWVVDGKIGGRETRIGEDLEEIREVSERDFGEGECAADDVDLVGLGHLATLDAAF